MNRSQLLSDNRLPNTRELVLFRDVRSTKPTVRYLFATMKLAKLGIAASAALSFSCRQRDRLRLIAAVDSVSLTSIFRSIRFIMTPTRSFSAIILGRKSLKRKTIRRASSYLRIPARGGNRTDIALPDQEASQIQGDGACRCTQGLHIFVKILVGETDAYAEV